MTSEWFELLRKEIARLGETALDDHRTPLEEYLSVVASDWKSLLPVDEATVEFTLLVKPNAKANDAFRQRLFRTMRQAGEVRFNYLEARKLLISSDSFVNALMKLCGSGENSSRYHDLCKRFAGRDPMSIGINGLIEISQACELSVTRFFSLVAQFLESSYVNRREMLISEGLARSDRRLTQDERRKQSVNAADSLLIDEKKTSINFLRKLAEALAPAE